MYLMYFEEDGKRVYTLKVSNGCAALAAPVQLGLTAGSLCAALHTSPDVPEQPLCPGRSATYCGCPVLQKTAPDGTPTKSAHPARFSPDDKFSRERITCKKRFGLLPTQQGAYEY